MPNHLSDRPEVRMTLLPSEAITDSRRGARSSAAIRSHAAARAESRSALEEEEQQDEEASATARYGDEQPVDEAGRYANAGPDCYWLEAG